MFYGQRQWIKTCKSNTLKCSDIERLLVIEDVDDGFDFAGRFAKFSNFNFPCCFIEEAAVGGVGADGGFVQLAGGVAVVGSAELQEEFGFAIVVRA